MMKFFFPLIVLLLSFEGTASAAPSKPLELMEVYGMAIEKTQTVSIQERRQSQLNEQVTQAKGAILPNLALNSSYTRQDAITSAGTPDNPIGSIRSPDQYSSRVTLSQPLFRGLRDFSGIGIAQAQLESQEFIVKQTKLNLYASVAQVYFNILAAEHDITNLSTLTDLTRKRIRELSAQAKLGRSALADVLFAKSQLAIIRSQMDAAYAQRDQSRIQFEFVTGLTKDSVLKDHTTLPKDLRDVDYYLNRIDTRPDLTALQQQVEATERSVSFARGQHLPSVDFSANYYLFRSGVLADSKWDLGFALSMPLFQGGVVTSQVRQATERNKEQLLILTQARREAEAQLTSAHRMVKSGLDQVKSLSNALKIAEQNYHQQLHDYELGLVRNLEVLQSLNSFQDLKRSLDRVHYQTLSAWAALQTASNMIFSTI